MMRRVIPAVVSMLSLCVAGHASAAVLVDDLSNGPDPISNFDFDLGTSGIQGPGATAGDFSGQDDDNDGFTGLNGGLWLFPDAADITFNVPLGDVLSMEIEGESFVGPGGTNVTFVVDTSTSGLQSFQFPIAPGPFSVSSNSVLVPGGGSVLSVESATIDSFEGRFDTITYNLVPEPGSFAVLGLGGLMLMRRR